jgi:hypothetical protein
LQLQLIARSSLLEKTGGFFIFFGSDKWVLSEVMEGSDMVLTPVDVGSDGVQLAEVSAGKLEDFGGVAAVSAIALAVRRPAQLVSYGPPQPSPHALTFQSEKDGPQERDPLPWGDAGSRPPGGLGRSLDEPGERGTSRPGVHV